MGLIKWAQQVHGFSAIWLEKKKKKKNLTINFFESEREVGKKNWGEETVFQIFLKAYIQLFRISLLKLQL